MTTELSLTQEYLLCALGAKKHGEATAIKAHNDRLVAGVVAAALVEMSLAGVVEIEDKTVRATSDLPEGMAYLKALYDQIAGEKPVRLSRLVKHHMGRINGKRVAALLGPLMATLEDAGVVESGDKGTWKADSQEIDDIIGEVRTSLLGDGVLTEQVTALTALLLATRLLKEYVSKHELQEISDRLDEVRESETGETVHRAVSVVVKLKAILISSAVMVSASHI